MTSSRRAVWLAGAAVLSWSTVATSFKIALSELTVYGMLLVAAPTALIVFALWLTVNKRWYKFASVEPRTWLNFALLGLVNPVVYYLTLFHAYDLLPAQIAQPVNYMWPILLLIMLAVFGKKPIAPVKYIGMAISLAGLTVISLGGSAISGSLSVSGMLWAFASAFLWALYWIINERLGRKADEDVCLFAGFLFGTIYLLAGTLFFPTGEFSTPGILSGIYIGLFEMGIPFLCFGVAIRTTTNPALVNQMCYLAPFLSLLFISMILDEPVVATTYIGLGLIVAGIAFNSRSAATAEAEPDATGSGGPE